MSLELHRFPAPTSWWGSWVLLHQTPGSSAKQFTQKRLFWPVFVALPQQKHCPAAWGAPLGVETYLSTPALPWLKPWLQELGVPYAPLRHCVRQTTFNAMDSFLTAADAALRTLFADPVSAERSPAAGIPEAAMSPEERKLSGALMRVNHVGEVCAQALYNAQAMVTQDMVLREHLLLAAREEMDHLAWTRERLHALGDRPSLLNPLWFAGAFAIGTVAAKFSDAVSLGFVVETENQVAAHLENHLGRLPEQDEASLAVVARMKDDEARHAAAAIDEGAMQLPPAAQGLMRLAAKVMTTVAHKI